MDERYDVVIVGGGFTGAALARALADGRRSILVLEARRTPPKRFAGELLHPARLDVLDPALVARLREKGADIAGFAVVPNEGATATLLPYESPGMAVEHRILVEELRQEAAAQPGVELRFGIEAEVMLDDNGRAVGVRTELGERIRADLVLGAEGRHSRVRQQLGLEATTRLLSYTAVLLVEDGELPHPGYGHVFLGAEGPILAYPIGGGRVRMCFDLTDACEPALLPERLRRDFARFVPEPLRTPMLRTLDGDGDSLLLVGTHAVRTRRCVAKGAALVGDAGGCSHPLTAAGMTVCLNDVRVLAEELARPVPADEALAHFEERRYRFARTRELLTDSLYDLFAHRGASGPVLRDALFAYWNDSVRARRSSIALLSCVESNPAVFFAEWGRVLSRAALDVARGRGGPRTVVLSDLARFFRAQLPSLLQPRRSSPS